MRPVGEYWVSDDGELYVWFDGDGRVDLVQHYPLASAGKPLTLAEQIRSWLGL